MGEIMSSLVKERNTQIEFAVSVIVTPLTIVVDICIALVPFF